MNLFKRLSGWLERVDGNSTDTSPYRKTKIDVTAEDVSETTSVLTFKSISCEDGVVTVIYTKDGEERVYSAARGWDWVDVIFCVDVKPTVHLEDTLLKFSDVLGNRRQGAPEELHIPDEHLEEVKKCLYRLGKSGRFINESQFNKIKQMVLSHPEFEVLKTHAIKNSKHLTIEVPVDSDEELGTITLLSKLTCDVDKESLTYNYGAHSESVFLEYEISDLKIVDNVDVKDILSDKFNKLVGE